MVVNCMGIEVWFNQLHAPIVGEINVAAYKS